jgi:large subunit ribosomal protein L9
MKVILKHDVKALGFKDDVVSVKNGYANNFLIPRGMAMIASPGNLKMINENIRQANFKQEKIKKDAEAMAGKVNGLSFTIGAKAGANGKIFGSITSLQISQALKGQGLDIDRRKIVIDQDIKMLGSYTATINLHREISVQVNLEVVAE